MAWSSSTSSVHKSCIYDVFLSFCGEDTRRTFVDHLYVALDQQGIHTFKDDTRLEKGKRINDELLQSIEDSRLYIIIFSKNYASSSWCLNELLKIMECQKKKERIAYPVFYDVEPTEVRKQSGSVGEALSIHENESEVGIWSEALKEAANLSGWDLRKIADGHEAQVIKLIVEEVSRELCSFNYVNIDEKLVGLEQRMQNLELLLQAGLDDVRMIGIKGMGGAGKTTLARAIFDKLSTQFEGRTFIENVREVSKASLSGLKSLQEQVLADVLNLKDHQISVSSVHDGIIMMKKRLGGKKVLVVLDDVDHISQLEALAGNSSWFKPGSRIIITTRDEQVLLSHQMSLVHYVDLLSDDEAMRLFSRYAFGKDIPVREYEKESLEVVRYAAGLPLTVKVLGSLLCGKDKPEWIDTLARLKTIPLEETVKKLEVIYESLYDVKNWKRENAIRMLDGCGFHARNGLRVLQRKSLITIKESQSFCDLWDMARKVSDVDNDLKKLQQATEETAASVQTAFVQLRQGQAELKAAFEETTKKLFTMLSVLSHDHSSLPVQSTAIPAAPLPPPTVTTTKAPVSAGLESAWDYPKWEDKQNTTPLQSGLPFGMFEHGNSSGSNGLFRDLVNGQDANRDGGKTMHQGDYRLRKLKMPLFDGDDAFGWVYKMEWFFDVQGFVTPNDRFRAALLCLEGQALAWFRWREKRDPIRHWDMLKAGILDRFQPSRAGDLYEQLFALQQSGTARAYVCDFEQLVAQIDGIAEPALLGAFVQGLKPDLRTVVRMFQPRGLAHGMKLAIMADEDQIGGGTSVGKGFSGGTSGRFVTLGTAAGGGSNAIGDTNIGGQTVGETKVPFTKLTDAEVADKRAKGLCYRCDGKFGPGHRCLEKSLRCLRVILEPGEEGEADEMEGPPKPWNLGLKTD